MDRKYLVPLPTVHQLLRAMDGCLTALEISGRRTFRYRSLYYDTQHLASYRGAATDRRRRFKVRRRDYLDTGSSFLEVKTRTGRGESSKVRLGVSPAPADALRARKLEERQLAFVHEQLIDSGIPLPRGELHPVLATAYDRTTLLAEDGDLHADRARITIDAGLSWTDPISGAVSQLTDLVVVETKASTRPSAADRALWAAGHRPLRLSKYAVGLALMRPELAANRWRRAMGRIGSTTPRPAWTRRT